MYTHIFVAHRDAEVLFTAYAPKPLKPGECGPVTEATFGEHFRQMLQAYLPRIGAPLEIVHSEDLFVLKFGTYLSRLPEQLIDLGIVPVRVEIVRFNSAPTRARAGYYENPPKGFSALVEHTFPVQYGDGGRRKPVAPIYAQNIKVAGRTLEEAQEFNSKLSAGHFNRFLVNAFE